MYYVLTLMLLLLRFLTMLIVVWKETRVCLKTLQNYCANIYIASGYISHRIRGAMVARLTPDQKVA